MAHLCEKILLICCWEVLSCLGEFQPGWGYLAMIVDAKTGEKLCVGTFLSPYVAMASGRCLTGRPSDQFAVRKYGAGDTDERSRQMYPVVAKLAERFRHYKSDWYVSDVGFAVSPRQIADDEKYGKVTMPYNEYEYEKWVSAVVFEERICQVPILKDPNENSAPRSVGATPEDSKTSSQQMKTTGKIQMMSVKLIKYGECVRNIVDDFNLTSSEINIEILLGVGIVCAKSADRFITVCNAWYGSPIVCSDQNNNQLLGVMSKNNCSPRSNSSIKMGFFSRSDRVIRDYMRIRKQYDLSASSSFETRRFAGVLLTLSYIPVILII